MKKNFSAIGLLTFSLFLLAAVFSCSDGNITTSIGREFTLAVGKTAVISGESLSLKFVEVTADSRCPKGVKCVWAGEAKCRTFVTYKGLTVEIILTQSGGSVTTQDFVQYKFNFQLEPYPEAGKKIADSDYKLMMTITR